MIDKNAPIGIFDSGIGGLTVAREVIRQIPDERFVYFGDTARVPYGSKSKTTIIKYTRQVIRFLKTQKVKAIVIACNTASAYALEAVREELDIPIIGVINSGAVMAVRATRNKKIGIIGTGGTVNSGIYKEMITKKDPEIAVFQKACPLLVPLVEEGLLHDSVTDEMISRYVRELQEKEIDTLVLGCTHYPLLRSTIGRIMGPEVKLINPAYETATELRQLLADQDIASDNSHSEEGEKYRYFVSDAAEQFFRFAATILPHVHDTSQINIEEY